MSALHLSDSDLAAMVREATKRAGPAQTAFVEAMVTPSAGDIQGTEDLLAIAAAARLMRHRCEVTASKHAHVRAALKRLDEHMDDALAVADRLRARREREAKRG